MHKVAAISIISIAIIFTFCNGANARGKQNISNNGEFSFQIESEGRLLSVHNHRGSSYVEGRWGNHYAIRVFNHTGRRAEAVVTVDGRNVITGQVGNYRKQRGYVIPPYDSVLIDGFRKSMNNVAAFRFTDVGDSYAARMGDATNVGVIGVAVFKENVPKPKPRPPIAYDRRRNRLGTGYGAQKSKKAPAARSGPRHESESMDILERDGNSYSRQGLGTQYGEDTYSPSTNTRFIRRHRRHPNATMAIRYDDRQGLIARGVLPRPAPYYSHPKPVPNPFPATPGFAPPPPGYYR